MSRNPETSLVKVAVEFSKSSTSNIKGIFGVFDDYLWFLAKVEEYGKNGMFEYECSLKRLRKFYKLVVNWKKADAVEFCYQGFKPFEKYEKWKLETDKRLVCIRSYVFRECPIKTVSSEDWNLLLAISELLIILHQENVSKTSILEFALSQTFIDKISQKLNVVDSDNLMFISIKLARFKYDFHQKKYKYFTVKDIAKRPSLYDDIVKIRYEINVAAIEDDLWALKDAIETKIRITYKFYKYYK